MTSYHRRHAPLPREPLAGRDGTGRDLTDRPQGLSPTAYAANRGARGSTGAGGSIGTDSSIGTSGSTGADGSIGTNGSTGADGSMGSVAAGGSPREGSPVWRQPGSRAAVGQSRGETPRPGATRDLLRDSVFTDFACALCLRKLVPLKPEPGRASPLPAGGGSRDGAAADRGSLCIC